MGNPDIQETPREEPFLRTREGRLAIALLSTSMLLAAAGVAEATKPPQPIDPYDPNATPEIYTMPSDEWITMATPPPYEGKSLKDIKHVIPEDLEITIYEK